MTTTAAQALVDTLRHHGVDRIFCVPGESYLAVLDACYDCPTIQVVSCRHESGAGFMAVADSKITGRAGTVFVTRGPGATNAAIAVHAAQQDGAPLVLFIGQVARKDLGRGAFQEIDYTKTFSDMAKWIIEVRDPDRLPDIAARAYQIARSATPGPVVVSLPEDMLAEPTAAPPAEPLPLDVPVPTDEEVTWVAERLTEAERPLLIVGGAVRTQAARRRLAACSESWQLPVVASYKHQDVLTNDHPSFAGHLGYGLPPRAWRPLGDADLILAVGTRLNDVTTQGYRLPKAPRPDQPLIHVHPDPHHLGRVFETTIKVVAEADAFLAALAAREAPPPRRSRAAWRERAHQLYTDFARWRPETAADGVDFGHVIAALTETLPPDAVIAIDAGNFGSWLHRYFPFRSTQLLLGTSSGAMGFGVPAAVAAALRCPDRRVVTLVGDGGFLMTGNELATAIQFNARLILLVSNNGSYGTIRLHQERAYPGRVAGTSLINPDFVTLAMAYGARGLTISTPEDARPVVREALATEGPTLVDVRTSLEHISAYTTLGKLADAAQQP